MEIVLACVYFALLAVALQVVTISVCAHHKALWQWHRFLQLAAFLWLAMAVVKIVYIDEFFPPIDGLKHEAASRDVADLLTSGRVSEAFADYLGAGNSAYQFMLGVFYALTGAPQVMTYAINGAFGFWGMLILLEILCRQTNCARLPGSVVIVVSLLPSGLLWTTSNLKEGPILWGISAMCYWSIALDGYRSRPSRVLPIVGLLVVGVMRPHIAIAWLISIGAGVMLHTRRYGLLFVGGVGAVMSLWLLCRLSPDMFEQAVGDSVTGTLSDFYDDKSSHFSGGSTFAGGNPIPVVSGLALILFRPWPTEVQEICDAIAGVEVWGLAAFGLINWKMAGGTVRLRMHPVLMTHVILLLLMGFFFSYMYNMGLVVRQRLMCFPSVLAIYSWPLLARQQASRTGFFRAYKNASHPAHMPRALLRRLSSSRK